MKRRHVLCCMSTAGWVVCPALLRAQPATRVRRVGVLSPYEAAMSQASPLAAVFAAEFLRVGYEMGRNLQVESLYAESEVERLPALAAELVRRQPELMVALGNDAIAAARSATSTLPIVMAFSAEPVGTGLVASLARPGANVTGTTWLSAEIAAKALELLRQAVPSLARLGTLGNPDTPGLRFYRDAFSSAAARLGIEAHAFPVHKPDQVDAALASIAADRVQALYVTAEPATEARVSDIAAFALKHKLPTIGVGPRLAEAGGLLYYGADVAETIARIVSFVDRILRGARPAELPIEQPSRFEFMVNQRTARALGLTLPANLLLRATRVIE
jgi:putative tryptophan/tyrosine transport system substrate-binding protein